MGVDDVLYGRPQDPRCREAYGRPDRELTADLPSVRRDLNPQPIRPVVDIEYVPLRSGLSFDVHGVSDGNNARADDLRNHPAGQTCPKRAYVDDRNINNTACNADYLDDYWRAARFVRPVVRRNA